MPNFWCSFFCWNQENNMVKYPSFSISPKWHFCYCPLKTKRYYTIKAPVSGWLFQAGAVLMEKGLKVPFRFRRSGPLVEVSSRAPPPPSTHTPSGGGARGFTTDDRTSSIWAPATHRLVKLGYHLRKIQLVVLSSPN